MNKIIKYWDEKLILPHIGNEINWIKSYLKENNIDKISYIDIGGNVGKFFDELSKEYLIEKCVIVEPSKKLFDYMVNKFKNNNQITLYNFGISNKNGFFKFDDSGIDYWSEKEINDSINLGIFKTDDSPGEVQFYETDYFFNNFNTIDPQKITFIKIDTENKDLFIIKGLTNFLLQNNIRPLILFENNYHADMSFDDATKIVNDFSEICGYETVDLNMHGDLVLNPKKNFKIKKNNHLLNKLFEIVLNFRIDKKFWNKDALTGEEYDFSRSKAAPYLKTAIKIAKLLKMSSVVEIGASRYAVTQKCLDYYSEENNAFLSPPCCGDGHSTFFFAESGFNVYSVDIDENVSTSIKWSFENLNRQIPSNLNVFIPKDGIEFLKEFNSKIDLLFLDGWDKGTYLYAEKHLEAFEASKDKLSDIHLILIDDTDFITNDGGKDKLLTPHLLNLGYIPLFNGRQTLFINTLDFEGKIFIDNKKNEITQNNILKKNILIYEENTKIIISLTTTPNRLSEIREGWGIKPAIEQLIRMSYNNYEIHLNIPYVNHKTEEEYIIPQWLIDLESSNDKLKIFRCNDYGSITKIVPTLKRIENPNTVIITVDDDLLYEDGFIEYHLKKRAEYPNSALGFAGIGGIDGSCHFCTTLEKDTKVKIIEGYKTVSYLRGFFKNDFFTDFVGQSWSDDILISAYLGKENIEKIIMNYEHDTSFNPIVESFPIIGNCPNEKSGCSLYREELVSDNHEKYYKLGFLEK